MENKSLILCDTDILIEFYKGNKKIVQNLEAIGQHNISLSIITAGELLYGAFNKRELNQIKKDTEALHLIDLDDKIGRVFLQLMLTYVLSHRLSLPDGLIAATAIANNIPLYTRNLKDFKYIEGLILYKEK
ncbi:MAG TPA: type II toxin-antitoxin system VapC family toxin [Cyclobacteriaceae bacterium]|nr:type II toxin-antitoxin system VapC family toxin [Cyclobacteriaceae bacterium]